MPDGADAHDVRVLTRISDVPREEWDALNAARDPARNPFSSFDFLDALEASGAVAKETGWLPQHLAVTGADGRLAAACPMYLKGHSYGEYVFDWGWADAFERAGGRYYPKLQAAIPFSPVTGPRLLAEPGGDEEPARVLLAGMVEAAHRHDVSSVHITFPTRAEWELAGRSGFLLREGRQFHWDNPGYVDFDDFLGSLASRKRKMLRKERARAIENDIDVRRLTGADLKPEHWDAFYEFYLDTAARKWGNPYLNREFFEEIGSRLADSILLVMAFRDGMPIAGSLNLFSDEVIYGRNWGCAEDHPFLHFECCYYQAMDFAIERGLKRVEAGAGGHHKIMRGYLPAPTYSAHWIAHPDFRNAVARFLEAERREVGRERDILSTRTPFRKGDIPQEADPTSAVGVDTDKAPRGEEDEEGF